MRQIKKLLWRLRIFKRLREAEDQIERLRKPHTHLVMVAPEQTAITSSQV
jgi:hypothetical protein